MRPGLLFFPLVWAAAATAVAQDNAVRTLVPWLFKQSDELQEIPFADVIAAATGRRIIPVDAEDADDRRVLAHLAGAMDRVLATVNADETLRSVRRINEVSSRFEKLMRTELDAVSEFACDHPRTKAGQLQRSGYPDLRLVDKLTGRIWYLDPKLYERGNRDSSFRTFYYEPKQGTNKVNDDARHVVVGIEHDGAEGGWKFLRWELVDLSGFRVRLKAEFEGSNRDLYRREAIVGAGPK